jgi:sec-independent protein translocase protein TatB
MGNLLSWHLLVVLAMGLIVLGPQRLPEAARTVGRTLNEFRRVSASLQQEVRSAFEGEDGINPAQQLRSMGDTLRSTASGLLGGPVSSPVGSGPPSGPAGDAASSPSAAPYTPVMPAPYAEVAFPPGDPSLN